MSLKYGDQRLTLNALVNPNPNRDSTAHVLLARIYGGGNETPSTEPSEAVEQQNWRLPTPWDERRVVATGCWLRG